MLTVSTLPRHVMETALGCSLASQWLQLRAVAGMTLRALGPFLGCGLVWVRLGRTSP